MAAENEEDYTVEDSDTKRVKNIADLIRKEKQMRPAPAQANPGSISKNSSKDLIQKVLTAYGAGFITKHLDDSHYAALSKAQPDQIKGFAHNAKGVWMASNFPQEEAVNHRLLRSVGLKDEHYSILAKMSNEPTESITKDEGELLSLNQSVPLDIHAANYKNPDYSYQHEYVNPQRRHKNDTNPRGRVSEEERDEYRVEKEQDATASSNDRITMNRGGFGQRIAAHADKHGNFPQSETVPENEIKTHPVVAYANVFRDRMNGAATARVANPEYEKEVVTKDTISDSEKAFLDAKGIPALPVVRNKIDDQNRPVKKQISHDDSRYDLKRRIGLARGDDDYVTTHDIRKADLAALAAQSKGSLGKVRKGEYEDINAPIKAPESTPDVQTPKAISREDQNIDSETQSGEMNLLHRIFNSKR